MLSPAARHRARLREMLFVLALWLAWQEAPAAPTPAAEDITRGVWWSWIGSFILDLAPRPSLLVVISTKIELGSCEPQTKDWLTKFGYLPPPDPVTGQLQTQEQLTKAITAMQRFGGLEATGVLDEATLELMKTPRCSLPDLTIEATRRKRFAQAVTKWSKRNLSWRVRTFPKESHLGHDTVRALMYYALKVWSDITPLNFHEVAGNNADIQIDFSKADHNDGYPFDGPGGTVAHAFFPGDHHTAGDTHFDDDEYWTFRSSDTHGMDLFAVAVHEFGHAIGLTHISAIESIMRPYYQGPVGDPLKYDLPYEDKVRIWQLYGVRESVSPTAKPEVSKTGDHPILPELPENRSTVPLRRDVPNRCNTHFDAVAQIRGEAFFFKGKYFWRLTRNKHLVSLQPAQIHRFWRGLPLNLESLDAVYERISDHKIVFFKGDRYWVFKDNNVEEGYPRPISDFGLPPGGIDAAFSWAHNDKTYFFKDNLYWCYDDHERRMDPGYPSEAVPWKGIPNPLDDAMRWSDGASYFFKGKEYWKVLDSDLEVQPGYPQSIARDWLVCSDMQADAPEAAGSSRTGARSRPGQHDESRSKNRYEVCSCTSGTPSLCPHPIPERLTASFVLAVWTAALVCVAL
ncbi:matrix metalloproteinase-17 isoform X1 [Melospiza georgiana]|uniref:matrix metalloproteinase-17 isoform X1 n=1 Tax=Melospiza georgiana TaxID=44398 RepID=UPI0025ABC4B3|nr:matrix metalloproteinase-17 isoform X1 [Melospiza georgiana]